MSHRLPTTQRTESGIPECPPSPEMSKELRRAVEDSLKEYPSLTGESPNFADIKAEASRLLLGLEPMMRPIDEAVLAAWIAPIQGSCSNPKDGDGFRRWFPGAMIALGEVEVGAFSRQGQQKLMRATGHFPTPREIWDAVSDDALTFRRLVRGLRHIAGYSHPVIQFRRGA